MKSTFNIARLAALGCALTLACGCTHLRSVAVRPTALPSGAVLPHHVALVLNQELTDYKHVYHEGGDNFIYAFGPPLQDYARDVATKSFQQVEVVTSVESAAALTAADLILIPRPIKSSVSIPVSGLKNEYLTFVVSWTAEDRATRKTVWLTTVTANSEDEKVHVNWHHGGQLYQRLFDDLSQKTYQAFQDSSELRRAGP